MRFFKDLIDRYRASDPDAEPPPRGQAIPVDVPPGFIPGDSGPYTGPNGQSGREWRRPQPEQPPHGMHPGAVPPFQPPAGRHHPGAMPPFQGNSPGVGGGYPRREPEIVYRNEQDEGFFAKLIDSIKEHKVRSIFFLVDILLGSGGFSVFIPYSPSSDWPWWGKALAWIGLWIMFNVLSYAVSKLQIVFFKAVARTLGNIIRALRTKAPAGQNKFLYVCSQAWKTLLLAAFAAFGVVVDFITDVTGCTYGYTGFDRDKALHVFPPGFDVHHLGHSIAQFPVYSALTAFVIVCGGLYELMTLNKDLLE